jgi:hypothetical protein
VSLSDVVHFLLGRRDIVAGVVVVAAALAAVPLAKRVGAAATWLARRAPRAGRERAVVLTLVALTFATAALCSYLRPPLAAVHDEFSYLLAADTFAHGRLTNPTPPSPEHFETFHVVVEPTYQSKYPPGQGLVLALGQVVFGHPIAGVWIGAALFAAATWWALRAVTGPGVALVWSVLAVLRFASSDYWAQSYWGGCLAAAGGALVVGATFRLARTLTPSAALALAAGSVVLALTRPFEGFVLAAIAHLVIAAARLFSDARTSTRSVAAACAAWAVVLCVGLGFLAHYNRAVTGDALRLPYLEHEERYAATPNLLLQGPIETPEYLHPEFERFWAGWVKAKYDERRESTWLTVAGEKLAYYGPFYVNWSWLPFLAVGLLFAHARGLRVMALGGAWAIVVVAFDNAHYGSPFTAVAVVACALGTERALRARDARVRAAAFAATCAVVLATALEAVEAQLGWRAAWPALRADLVGRLTGLPGDDIVFVRTDYSTLDAAGRADWDNIDWVFNGADLRGAPVLFARDLGEEANRRLLEAFAPRLGWRLCLPAGVENGPAFDALEPITSEAPRPASSVNAR